MFNNDARFPTRSEQARAQEKGDVPWGRRGSQWTLACLRSAHRSFARGGQVVLASPNQQVSQYPLRSSLRHRASRVVSKIELERALTSRIDMLVVDGGACSCAKPPAPPEL